MRIFSVSDMESVDERLAVVARCSFRLFRDSSSSMADFRSSIESVLYDSQTSLRIDWSNSCFAVPS